MSMRVVVEMEVELPPKQVAYWFTYSEPEEQDSFLRELAGDDSYEECYERMLVIMKRALL